MQTQYADSLSLSVLEFDYARGVGVSQADCGSIVFSLSNQDVISMHSLLVILYIW
jgi:hypothetical protein